MSSSSPYTLKNKGAREEPKMGFHSDAIEETFLGSSVNILLKRTIFHNVKNILIISVFWYCIILNVSFSVYSFFMEPLMAINNLYFKDCGVLIIFANTLLGFSTNNHSTDFK